MRSWFFLQSQLACKGLYEVIRVPMEKLLNRYDKESMKMAMLKHEETFKEQVYELHRLYQIQKLLMKNLANTRKPGQEFGRWSFTNSNLMNDDEIHKRPAKCLDLERPAEEYVAGKEGQAMLETEDESGLELTLGLTTHSRKRISGDPLPSDSAASFSSSSTGSSHKMKSNSGYHLRTNSREELWGLDMASSNPGFLGGRKNSSVIEGQFRQERHKNAPWLFQALSLKTN